MGSLKEGAEVSSVCIDGADVPREKHVGRGKGLRGCKGEGWCKYRVSFESCAVSQGHRVVYVLWSFVVVKGESEYTILGGRRTYMYNSLTGGARLSENAYFIILRLAQS